MESHTKRTQRLLWLWLDLQQAIRDMGQPEVRPWNCSEPGVARLWEQITEPMNQRVLEEWLYQSVDGQPAEWARKALEVCRCRRK